MIAFLLSLHSDTKTCYTCLDGGGYKTHFWCVTTQECLPLDKINDCKNVESHDLVLNASRCCSDISNQRECISPQNINFCTWCPELNQSESQRSGQCLYRSDITNIQRNCHGYLDLVSPCSSYKTCKECSKDIPCIWCATRNSCITKMFDSQYGFADPFKCKDQLMMYDNILEICACVGEAYFDNGLCEKCPPNVSATKYKDSCACGPLKQFNKASKQCECEENTFPHGDICIQCPEGSIATENTCICSNPNEYFNFTLGTCECPFERGFGLVNQTCIKCQNGEHGSENGCICPEGKRCDQTVLQESSFSMYSTGTLVVAAIVSSIIVILIIKQIMNLQKYN